MWRLPGLFDILKKGYTQATGEPEAGVVPSIGFGVFSAFTGQLVAYPLETVVRQMQVPIFPLPLAWQASCWLTCAHAAVIWSFPWSMLAKLCVVTPQVRGGQLGSSGSLLSVLRDIVRRGGPAALYK